MGGAEHECSRCGRPLRIDRPFAVAEEDFEVVVLGAPVPVLVDFHADWCGPCRMLEPILAELAQRWGGRVLVAKVDTDEARDLTGRHGIRGVPTVILFDEGEEVDRSAGIEPERLQAMVQRVAAKRRG